MKNNNISVIVPVYNSEGTLNQLCKRLLSVLKKISGSYEIILVNDGSKDNSCNIISQLVKKHEKVEGINLMRNFGQHNALLCGIRAAKYEMIVTIDDDLQHPPEEIPKMLDKLNEGFDVIYGTPQKEQHGLWRDFSSRITKIALQTTMGAETARKTSAFRVFRTQIRDAFAQYRGTFISVDVLLTWGTVKFSSVKVRHEPRKYGKSNYTFRKLITQAFNMMTGFSVLPLQIASMMGFAFAFFGLWVLIYVVGRYLIEGSSVTGFPFLASIIAIFSGVQLLTIGIIGEYLARVHFRAMDKPQYIISNKEKIE